MVVLGQYNLVLLGIKWYWVSKVLLCQYILKTAKIWSGVTDPDTLTHSLTEYRATQFRKGLEFRNGFIWDFVPNYG